ncbi:MAG TPA: KUP/HAK/KT family potassium transporter [Methanoregula sp.]|nr:KUP/HAK/KT family potassium transporter [Methanoregula sp.]
MISVITDTVSSVVKSIGLVFGDIGTSPIYALTAIFLIIPPRPENVLGILSLVIWTLTILVTTEYTFLAMSLGKKGEGGTIVLREILLPLLKSGHQVTFVSFLTVCGIALFIGDGVITPAISLLSAVEGIRLIPTLAGISQVELMAAAGLIALGLFLFQVKGTERIAFTFGPIMVVWFLVLAVTGLVSLVSWPGVLFAINPLLGISFLTRHGLEGFLILSSVILVATGGEALYADMGHLGKEPIIRAWHLVFIALAFSYLGQGSFIITHPEARNILFEMVYSQFQAIYIPFLILSIIATIIASQAMISGVFSIIYQGITTRILPLMHIDFTSPHIRSQIYIDSINWLLFFAVILVIIVFRSSENLALAYGLAVCGTMTITGIMLTWIFIRQKTYVYTGIALCVLVVDVFFLVSSFRKVPYGGYWSLLIGVVPFLIIFIYTSGQKKLAQSLRPVPFDQFVCDFKAVFPSVTRIPGSALFFIRDFREVPPYIYRILFTNGIMYDENIFISIIRTDQPFGRTWGITSDITPGLSVFEIYLGYMEIADIDALIHDAGVQERTIFYGMEEIITMHPVWRVFAAIKRLSPSVVQFYKLSPEKVHGVLTRVEL